MSTEDQNRLANHVKSIVETIENGSYSKDNLEVMHDSEADDQAWYIFDYENNEVLDNEWFDNEDVAKAYLANHKGAPDSGFDYLQDALDIEYICNGAKEYLGARVLVAFGGPNIWINTRTKQVEGYWWGDKSIQSYNDDAIGLDDSLEQLFNC